MFRRFLTALLLLALFFGINQIVFARVPVLRNQPRLEIVLGKLCFLRPEERTGAFQQNVHGCRRIRFKLLPERGGTVNISCCSMSSKQAGWIEIAHGFQIQEFWVDWENAEYVFFSQPAGNKLILLETGTVTPEEIEKLKKSFDSVPDFKTVRSPNAHSWKALSIWEFLFFLPTEFEEAFQTILENQTGSQNTISQFREQFLESLMENAFLPDAQLQQEVERWEKGRKWIQELANDDFNTRRQADWNLRHSGTEVLLLINQLDSESLSPEVQVRLERIVQVMNSRLEPKSAMKLEVRWWAQFPQMWAAILEFGSLEQRKTAWAVLQKRFPDLFEKMNSVEYKPEMEFRSNELLVRKIRDFASGK